MAFPDADRLEQLLRDQQNILRDPPPPPLRPATEAELEELRAAVRAAKVEKDPTGLSPHQPGAKLDAGKPPILRGLLHYFPRALRAVAEISTVGVEKYTWKGWETVPDGIARYGDALGRHVLDEPIDGLLDPGTGKLHAAHAAWNSLARLELILRELEEDPRSDPGAE